VYVAHQVVTKKSIIIDYEVIYHFWFIFLALFCWQLFNFFYCSIHGTDQCM